MDCIFCKIAKKEIKTDIIFENENIIAFPDKKPIVPIHILIIPKKHIESIANLEEEDEKIMGSMIMAAKKIGNKLNISKKGYKLLIRVGNDGGQEIKHIHLHLLGGGRLYEDIHLI